VYIRIALLSTYAAEIEYAGRLRNMYVSFKSRILTIRILELSQIHGFKS